MNRKSSVNTVGCRENERKDSGAVRLRDIQKQIKNLSNVDISPEPASKIGEKIMPEVTAWQDRPLEEMYPFVFLDCWISLFYTKFSALLCELLFEETIQIINN